MPNLTTSIPHQQTRAEAKRRVEELVVQLQKQYGTTLAKVDRRWTGDTMDFAFSSVGMAVTGQVFVEDQAVRLDVVLPWALSMLAGGIKQRIEEEGRKFLSNDKTSS